MKLKIGEDGTIDSQQLKDLIRQILKELGVLKEEASVDQKSDANSEPRQVEVVTAALSGIAVTSQTENLDELFSEGKEVIFLPDSWADKEITVVSEGMIRPYLAKALIGKNVRLTFPSWNKTPTQLFDLQGKEEFGIRGCTFVCPPNRPLQTGFPDKELFGWTRDSVSKGKFAYLDGQEIIDKDRVTFGLSRFCYSADSNERIYLIAENIWHNGFNFTQIKNPEKGNLWLILKNVNIHNPIVEAPRSHYYSPTRFKVKVKVQNGIAELISNNRYDQILTHWGYNMGSQRSILHFDRYVFDISEANLLDATRLKLEDKRPELERISPKSIRTNFELQPLDRTNMGVVVTKQIDESRRFNWVYEFDTESEEKEISALEQKEIKGEYDAFIVCKGNALFSFPLNKDAKFGEDYWESGVITISHGYGWTWYNEEFSGYIENYQGLGYHRNSGGSGITQGLTIRNSKFQENPPLATADLPQMPQEAQDYINFLRSL